MKARPMAVIRELGFCNLNARDDFDVIRRFFEHEVFTDEYLAEELELTEIMLPPLQAKELKELFLKYTQDYDVRKAAMYLKLQRYSYSSSGKSDYDVRKAAMYLKLQRYSYSSSGKSYASQPFDIRKLFYLIQQLEKRMANVIVENQDFETLVRHYDRDDAFFYLDPPYFSTEGMYPGGFGKDDHERLRDLLFSIKGRFLLSYNDCPEIRELYRDCEIFSFSRTHSMAQRYEAGKEFKELLIANYDFFERVKNQPQQLTLFDDAGKMDYFNKILKESKI